MSADLAIRAERSGDERGVRAVLEAAFGGSAEADLAEWLRTDGDLILALVAERRGDIAGFIAFPRLSIELDRRVIPVAGLAPVGVRPEMQRQGIGCALIRAGLAQLKDRAEALVFVLGDPAYYGRFGFAATDGFSSRYAGPHFQALRLAPDAPRAGRVVYPGAFDEL
ncbi:MAG: N-acetyltransferase [Rhizobiales bacterium]|nr:N-acetyltransferase [Hyphomicrobiales bacterium]